MPQPWHLGPVPVTEDGLISKALVAALSAEGAKGLWLEDFKAKTGSEGVDGKGLLKHVALLRGLLRAQPALRFKSLQVRKCLMKAKHDNADVTVNPTKLSDGQWSRLVAAQISTLLYHLRRCVNSNKALQTAMGSCTGLQQAQLKELVEDAKAAAGARPSSSGTGMSNKRICEAGGGEMDVQAAAAGPDEVEKQAAEASLHPLPSGRGALKKMVAKKPAGKQTSCPTCKTPSFDVCKVIFADKQSYITRFDPATGKWPLLVSCGWENHKDVIERLWTIVCTKPKLTKESLLSKKATMKTFKKPAKAPSAAPTAGTAASAGSSMLEWMEHEYSAFDGEHDDPSQRTCGGSDDEDNLPAWWDELAS